MTLTEKDKKEIEIFKRCGVFDFFGGVAFIYRDPQGILKAIKVELNTFRKGKVLMNEQQLHWIAEINRGIDNNNNSDII